MTNKKFIFHKDQFGVLVYYAGMNGNPHQSTTNFKINNKIDFDSSKTCIVPLVTRISTTSVETKETGYKQRNTATTISVSTYLANRDTLELDGRNAKGVGDINKEVVAQVALRHLKEDWEVQTEEVEVYRDYDFEIIDIEYPADERLIPLRHLDEEKINYFRVDGEVVAKSLIHQLCKRAGLKESRGEVRCYDFPGYQDQSYSWRIENVTYGSPLNDIKLSGFTGHLQECRVYMNDIEFKVRECFDEWLISGKTARGLNVKFMINHLETIRRHVCLIASKVKTKNFHTRALHAIELAKAEIQAIGVQELIDGQDNLDEEFDNDENVE